MSPWTIIGLVVLILLFLGFASHIYHTEWHGTGKLDRYNNSIDKEYYYIHPMNIILCIICAVGIYYVVKDLF